MTPEDRKPFIETVLGFAELKGKQLSAPALELYWRALSHWELTDFREAAEQLLRSSEFMPTPKDFEDLRKAGRMTGGEAWAWVLSGFRHLSVPEPSDEDRRIIERAVGALGGWQAIGRNSPEQNDRLERRFCEHFEAIQDAEDIRGEVPAIAYSGPRSISQVAVDLAKRLEK